MRDSILKQKSYPFAIRIVKLYKHITSTQNEYVLTKQILRSGTSIGANIAEAQDAQSNADFRYKLNIALKEARETEYWLSILKDIGFITELEYDSLNADCVELIKLLITIIKKIRV